MAEQPNALWFGGDLPASGAPCHVAVSADGLTVAMTGTAARAPFVLPFDHVTVGAGGFDHDHLTVKWEDAGTTYTLFLKDPPVIEAVRAQAPPVVAAALQRTAEEVRGHRSRRRTLLLIAVGMVGALLLLLWIGSDWIAEFAVSRIPVSWEESLGEAAHRQFLAGQTVLKQGPAADAVQTITTRLTDQLRDSPYKFHVEVVESGVVNAFALPGGYLVVYSGLLKKAESPEEVAGVLAHEVNHVLKRHGMERIVKTIGLVAVVTILTGNQQGLAGIIQELGIELGTLKFGREQETEADVEGLRLLHRARIAGDGMVAFFERLATQDGQQIEILSSHPVSEGRADRLKAEIARLPKLAPEPFAIEWEQVRAGLK